MAMIKCPECGKEVSDKARSCPNCGNPMTDNQLSFVKDKLTLISWNLSVIKGLIIFAVIVSIIVGIVTACSTIA